MGSTCFSARSSKWTGRQHLLIFSGQSCLVGKDQHRAGLTILSDSSSYPIGNRNGCQRPEPQAWISPVMHAPDAKHNWGVELFVTLLTFGMHLR
jgi:hypothetical protein